jgi:hypothetical protein
LFQLNWVRRHSKAHRRSRTGWKNGLIEIDKPRAKPILNTFEKKSDGHSEGICPAIDEYGEKLVCF